MMALILVSAGEIASVLGPSRPDRMVFYSSIELPAVLAVLVLGGFLVLLGAPGGSTDRA